MTTERPLETGWLPDTPVDDTLLRRFLFNQADVNAVIADALGGRADRTDDVFLADASSPIPFLNQAVLARPVLEATDPALDAIDEFFGDGPHPATVLSIWPTPDLSARGWELVGHPAMVARAPGPIDREAPGDVDVIEVTSADQFANAERIAVEGYPMEEGRGLPPGAVFPATLADSDVVLRLGTLDGEPVGLGNVHVGHGVVNLCLAATMPAARRRGVWEALVWARVGDGSELPAVAFTSDHSRPGFVRMGFLPLTRFTLWVR